MEERRAIDRRINEEEESEEPKRKATNRIKKVIKENKERMEKVLKENAEMVEELVKEEIGLMSRLEHPHIVRMFGASQVVILTHYL